ncbi:MAG TPA: VCBS repeat-containing protein [Leptolyngbyaceae cyanobacterium M33_DOE_097]|nr:VCBS repeat-containing protein [Leptolyngbyaceae cyanobacterium M33_DOE_097]
MADTLNDNSYSTTQRSINYSPTAQTFGGDSSYSLDATDRQDVYRLNWSRSSGIAISLSPQNGNADLELRDSGNNLLYSSANTGAAADAILLDRLNAGTYYIRIHNDAEVGSSAYSFKVQGFENRSDIIWRNYSASNGGVFVWKMDGIAYQGFDAVTYLPYPEWRAEAVGDFDGDGISDIAWRNTTSGGNVIWLLDANNKIKANASIPAIPISSGWRIAGAGDFTGDGKADIIWRNVTTGNTSIWQMDGVTYKGSIGFAPNILSGGLVSPVWSITGVADFNLDGNLDIAWRNTTNGENYLWYMNKNNFTSGLFLVDTNGSNKLEDQRWRMEGVGDFNRDGNPDLLWRFYGGNTALNFVWYMNNNRMVSGEQFTTVSDNTWEIVDSAPKANVADLGGNTMNTAFDIGTVSTSTVSYNETVGRLGDQDDFYRFKVGAASTVKVGLSQYNGQVNIQLIHDKNNNGVIDDLETVYDNSVNSAQVPNFISDGFLAEQTGTYFVRVRSTTTGGTPYNLNLSTVAANLVNLSVIADSFRILNMSSNPITEVTLGTNPISIQLEVKVKNNNPTTAIQDVPISFYISRDSNIVPNSQDPNTQDYEMFVSAPTDTTIDFAGGETKTLKFTVSIPDATEDFWVSDQSYFLGAYVDPQNVIAETNNNDNAISKSFVVKGTLRPDIVGTQFAINTSASSPGQPIQITGKIKNQGTRQTGSSFLVQFVLSKNNVIGDYVDDLPLTGFIVVPKSLSAGEEITFDTNLKESDVPGKDKGYLAGTNVTPPLKLPSLSDEYAIPYWQSYGNGSYYLGMILDFTFNAGERTGDRANNSGLGLNVDYGTLNISGIVSGGI